MRSRTREKHFFFNDAELNDLTQKAKKAGLSEAALVRMLLRGYAPKEKPDEEFYSLMRKISVVANSINQLAQDINLPEIKREAEHWRAFRMEVKRRFLEPEKVIPNGGD